MNQREISLLQGLDEFHYKLYFHALRRYMDYSTGIVGVKRRISYQSIREDMYIDPKSGVNKTGYPSKPKIQRSIKLLEKIGLLTLIQENCLIFECLLATRDYQVQKQADTAVNTEPDTVYPQGKTEIIPLKSISNESKNYSAIGQADTPQNAQADTPPLSVKKKKDIINNIVSKFEIELPDWLPKKTWDEFIAYRKQIKKPMTQQAQVLNINKLEKLRETGNDPILVIEQSIMNGWNGLFELKNSIGAKPSYEANSRPYYLSKTDIFDQVISGAFKQH